jgi:hypothetical protein
MAAADHSKQQLVPEGGQFHAYFYQFCSCLLKKTLIKPFRLGRTIACSLGAALGGMTWIATGIVLTFRPAGHPPHSFRHTVDGMPWLAAGLLLIGTTLAALLLSYRRRYGWTLYIASLLAGWGSGIYALGRVTRIVALQSVGWEPLLPLGHLLTAIGLAGAGLAAVQRKVLPKSTGLLITVSGLCLLGFNDQYLPVMAIPFGACVVLWSARLLFFPAALPLASQGKVKPQDTAPETVEHPEGL